MRCVITVIAACLFVCVQFSQWLHLLFFCFPSVNASRNHAAVLTSNFSQYCYHVLYTQAYTFILIAVVQLNKGCVVSQLFLSTTVCCALTLLVGLLVTRIYTIIGSRGFLLRCTCIVKHITPLFHDPGAWFTKYLMIIWQASYDNAKVTIDLWRTSNLQNILWRCKAFLRYSSLAKSQDRLR